MSQRTLIELLHGKGAHADPVACIEDVSANLAGRTVEGVPYSIWQLVFHMNYWMDYELRRIRGLRPAYPEHAAESWPKQSLPSGGEWLDSVAQFAAFVREYEKLAQSSPEELARVVEPMNAIDRQHSPEVLAVLWQMTAHNSYHTGQIATLRRALGAWPPRGGGDTW